MCLYLYNYYIFSYIKWEQTVIMCYSTCVQLKYFKAGKVKLLLYSLRLTQDAKTVFGPVSCDLSKLEFRSIFISYSSKYRSL